jgi:hypothetical protein
MLKPLVAAAVFVFAVSAGAEQPVPDAQQKPLMRSVDAKLKELVADGDFSDADATAAGEHVLALLVGPMPQGQKFISRVSREPRDRVLVFVAYEFTPDGKFTGYNLEFVHPKSSKMVWLESIAAAHYE